MDILLITGALALLLLGIIGCVLPVLPGPPIGFLGILLASFSSLMDFSTEALLIYAFLAILVTVLDYIVPVWGTKKMGGSKYGTWGSTIGLILAVIVLPVLGITIGPFGLFGIILGPFLGAFVGELISGKKSEEAGRAALGAFLGFVTGVLMKLMVSGFYIIIFLVKLWQYIFRG
jgi:hypothetical protein